ncbi:LAFA_0D10286g1_1 [Lachancea sp. 'fantastica']|nr:LAFA_0D10286g1_1 [Lachancea sp. 'fantastica']
MPIQLWGKDQIKIVYENADNNNDPLHYREQQDDEFGHYARVALPTLHRRVLIGTNRWISKLSSIRLLRVDLVHWTMLFIWLLLLAKFSTIYTRLYTHSALLTTICTNALLFGISDILAQGIRQNGLETSLHLPLGPDRFSNEDEEEDLEDSISIFNDYGPVLSNSLPEGPAISESPYHFQFFRWGCFMAWGSGLAFFQVPWYRILNYLYTEDPSIVQTIERVLSDQLVYSPISLFCFFAYSNFVMEGGDASTLKTKVENVYLGTLGFNYMLWPPVQFINFMLMPKNLQVPFSSSIGVMWNCFLSMRNASTVQKT